MLRLVENKKAELGSKRAKMVGQHSRRAHFGLLDHKLYYSPSLIFFFSNMYAILNMICKIFCLESAYRVIRPNVTLAIGQKMAADGPSRPFFGRAHSTIF